MNTENKTRFSSKELSVAFRQRWAELARDKDTRNQLTGTAHLLRALMLNIPVEKQFHAVTNPVKLRNGMSPWLALEDAARNLPSSTLFTSPSLQRFLELFEGIVTREDTAKLPKAAQDILAAVNASTSAVGNE